MSIKVESSTDTVENLAAINKPAESKVDSPAAAKEQAETQEASGASEESEEIQDIENDDESEDATEGAESKDGDKTGEDGKPKKKNGYKKRIDKLGKRASAAEERALRAEREVQFLREQATKGQSPAAKVEEKKSVSSEGEPKVDDFETHTEYVKAVTKWEIAQSKKADDAKKSKEKRSQDTQVLFKSYNDNLAELKKTVTDFDDAMEDVAHVNMPDHVQQLILESNIGAELAYELAKNPEEFERICKLNEKSAAREIGRFEAKLNPRTVEKKETVQAKTTKAPAPITPVGSGGISTKKKSIHDADLTQAEYEALRAKERAKRSA